MSKHHVQLIVSKEDGELVERLRNMLIVSQALPIKKTNQLKSDEYRK